MPLRGAPGRAVRCVTGRYGQYGLVKQQKCNVANERGEAPHDLGTGGLRDRPGPAKRSYSIPAGDAGVTLREFVEQPGEQLDKYVVASIREGQAAAITQQRIAPNVKNVAATDAFGNIADGNAAEALRLLPGVSAINDENESRFVMVRGIDASALVRDNSSAS